MKLILCMILLVVACNCADYELKAIVQYKGKIPITHDMAAECLRTAWINNVKPDWRQAYPGQANVKCHMKWEPLEGFQLAQPVPKNYFGLCGLSGGIGFGSINIDTWWYCDHGPCPYNHKDLSECFTKEIEANKTLPFEFIGTVKPCSLCYI